MKITALYGLRRSEVLGLKWDSVDFTAGRLTIKHTVSKVTTTVCKDKTKNSSSHRLELRIIRERVRSGMRNARAKGARIGRPQTTLDDIPANFLRHYPQYKKGAFNLTELARLCGISRTTAYKYIGLLEG
ncbi:MAG: hypothetical protein K6C12_06370 [Oscillospiraceae bacterium]|nr:hypothetical protein [Oscillospiraceae bacterium]